MGKDDFPPGLDEEPTDVFCMADEPPVPCCFATLFFMSRL